MSASPSGLEAYLDVEERESRDLQVGNLKRLIALILQERASLWLGIAAILIGTFAALLEPRLFGYAIDEAIVPRRWDLLKRLTAIFLAVTFVRVIATIGQGYLFEFLGQRVTQKLRIELFSHLQRQPISIFDRNPAGRLLTRVTNDIESLNEMFSAGFVSMVGNILMVVGIYIWLFALDVKLAFVAAAVLPFMIVASAYFSERLRVAYRDSRSKLSALNAFIAENFMGMRVVHLFNREKIHLDRFDRINQWYADAQIGTVRVFALFQPTITLASGIAMALVIGFGGVAARTGALKVGMLFAFFSYVLAAFQPIREIADKWNIFLSGLASAERIFSILSWKPELEREAVLGPAPKLPQLQGRITFESVWFAYDQEHWVLKDFSLEIHPGARVGIVGHTGSGKTTLISLLLRFYEPQRGRILLDGRDIRELDRRALRAAIGIIQQDVFLFSGSIQDNIAFWSPDSPKLSEFYSGLSGSLPGEAARELQERGSNLSVGQRQVLAFARAAQAEPQIWILDEATANMDSETERRLGQELDRVSRGRTSLLIAHRLATVRDADLIIVLHQGRIVEQGSHAGLVASNGLYARLNQFQSLAH